MRKLYRLERLCNGPKAGVIWRDLLPYETVQTMLFKYDGTLGIVTFNLPDTHANLKTMILLDPAWEIGDKEIEQTLVIAYIKCLYLN